MPPFLMLLAVAFVVLMVMFGNNPMDKWRAEQEKYGKDPLTRDIKKFNEERAKKGGGGMTQYKPPPGATTFRLPPNQAQIPAPNPFNTPDADKLVRPAPEIPMSQWDSPYPKHMLAPPPGAPISQQNNMPPATGGTSLMPGFSGRK